MRHPHLSSPSTLLLLLLPSLISAIHLPPSLHLTNLTAPPNPPPLPPIKTLDCFNTTTPLAYPLDLSSCDIAVDLLLHDPSGIMNTHTYSWNARVPGSFGIPADWHDYQCQILLTSGYLDAVDRFSLVDVVVVARRIMKECVPISKQGLGGLGVVGNRKGLFVAVNGPQPPGGG